jgi:hypothetical protein
MAETTSDWEQINVDPAVYRHRNRGSLWVVNQQLVYLPGASLSDLLALQKSIAEIGKPVVVEPVKPPPFVAYPKWVIPNASWISYPGDGPAWVEGFKFSIDRDSSVVSVLVNNAAEEARVKAVKGWSK